MKGRSSNCFAFFTLAVSLLIVGTVRLSVAAQRPDWDDATLQQMQSFDNFLASHPWIAQKLYQKPSLVNNKDFVKDNHELRDFLEDHPGIREEFRANPRAFMRRERDFQRRERYQPDGDAWRNGMARFDAFLDTHEDVREDLMKRPSLVHNHDYLEDHRDLRVFLDNHPGIREALTQDPRGFMDREREFYKRGEVD